MLLKPAYNQACNPIFAIKGHIWNCHFCRYIHLPPEQHNKGNNIPPVSHPAYARLSMASQVSSSHLKAATYFMHLDVCCHDTGSNCHVFHDKAMFETYKT